MNLKGKSFCTSSSCLVVGELSRLAHREMVLLGLAYFLSLGLALALGAPAGLLGLLASGGLFAEAIFVARQVFEYRLLCPFCLVTGIGVVLTALPVLYGLRGPKASLAGALVGVLAGFWLTANPLVPLKAEARPAFADRPPVTDLYLIYSPECPHCHEVLEVCRNLPGANLNLCRREKARGLFRLLGLKGVPVLVVERASRWEILEGSGPIIAYLKERFGSKPSSVGPALLEGILIPENGGVCSELKPRCE
ncbi:hypothetical protein [Thermosulfurimonas sp. F29]|uniref:hypothetical protein n=1 Tax=Thermosulfurimonas sp. F29 TaxID=2867247 RepID=UPI001C839320|nr:hypothetical protein [Thermosulfurimonas sp. F29]MBX6423186.1 hypothetical protein [Thermosulfurimonas sp. F29]